MTSRPMSRAQRIEAHAEAIAALNEAVQALAVAVERLEARQRELARLRQDTDGVWFLDSDVSEGGSTLSGSDLGIEVG